MVSIGDGSVLRSIGTKVRSAITDENILHAMGVAYSLEGGGPLEDQVSMYYFKRVVMKNCAGERTGYFSLLRSGALQMNQVELSMSLLLTEYTLLRRFIDNASEALTSSVFSDSYILTRLPERWNEQGPISIIDCRFDGDENEFIIDDEVY